jgi:hypothetical protein
VNEKGAGFPTGISASFPMGIHASFALSFNAGSIKYAIVGRPITAVIMPPMMAVAPLMNSRLLMGSDISTSKTMSSLPLASGATT